MPRTTALLASLALALACGAPMEGCSSTRTNSPTRAQAANSIDAQNWSDMAQKMLVSLNQTELATRFSKDGMRPMIAIGDFQNNTDRAAFTRQKDFLYNELRAALVNSGKFTATMEFAGTGGDVDELLRDIRKLRNDGEVDQSTIAGRGTLRAPDLILYGELGKITSRGGRSTTYDYQINLRLKDTVTGAIEWEGVVPLSKTFTRGVLG